MERWPPHDSNVLTFSCFRSIVRNKLTYKIERFCTVYHNANYSKRSIERSIDDRTLFTLELETDFKDRRFHGFFHHKGKLFSSIKIINASNYLSSLISKNDSNRSCIPSIVYEFM